MGKERFDYQITKSGVVRVFWEGRCVTEVKGKKADALAEKLLAADEETTQALLQRITGNFRRGNEHLFKAR